MLRDLAKLAIRGVIIPPNANPDSMRGTLRRQRRELADGFLQGNDLFIPHVFRQQAGKVAVGTRVVIALEKYTFRSRSGLVGSEAYPGKRNLTFHVVLRHQEVSDFHPCPIL